MLLFAQYALDYSKVQPSASEWNLLGGLHFASVAVV